MVLGPTSLPPFGRGWSNRTLSSRTWSLSQQAFRPPESARVPTTSAHYTDNLLRSGTAGRGPTYGASLNFRGLQHAPINEQGVVFLFGMVCHELGFVVESVRTGSPDCEAKR